MINPITTKIGNAKLTLEAFPRSKGYEVVGVLERPGMQPAFASHGIVSSPESAGYRMKEVVSLMEKRARVKKWNPSKKWHKNRLIWLTQMQATAHRKDEYSRFTSMLSEERRALQEMGLTDKQINQLERDAEFAENPCGSKKNVIPYAEKRDGGYYIRYRKEKRKVNKPAISGIFGIGIILFVTWLIGKSGGESGS